MITNKLDENTYEIFIYDWINLHDDYLCGHAKIDRSARDDSDAKYWLFYPAGCITPISAGDLKAISRFIASLNK